jgi:hypothetical protein
MTREAQMIEELLGDLIPETFGLIHEYYTPTILADAIADASGPLRPSLAGTDGVVPALEPSAGIGRLNRAFSARHGTSWMTHDGIQNLVVSNPPYGERGPAALMAARKGAT